jgi:hypothetical protein
MGLSDMSVGQPSALAGHVGTTRVRPTTLAQNPHDWEPEWLEDRFSALLECQNGNCGELVSIGGRVTHSRGFDYEGQETMLERLRPTQLSPAPHLFRLPEGCPNEVRKELELAFTLYWQDVGSATNRLRVAVEALLTDLGIARTVIDAKKRKRVTLSLHARIEKYALKNRDAADFLMAIKWVGNSGSHSTLGVDRETFIASTELFEHAIDIIYVRTSLRLKRVAKSLTDRKGKPKTKSKKRKPRAKS